MSAIHFPDHITFEDVAIQIIDRDGKPWVTAIDLGRALGYHPQRGDQTGKPFGAVNYSLPVKKIYDRHADEFADDMTALVAMQTAGGAQTIRIFSPRGAHLIAMFARTDRAKAFRRWILDVLDRLKTEERGSKSSGSCLDAPPAQGGQRLTPGQRFAEERRRLGYATKREFAEATGARLNQISGFEDLNVITKNLAMIYRLMDIGFDLRYWQTGERTPYRPVSAEESALLQAWRRAGVEGVQRHLASQSDVALKSIERQTGLKIK